MKNLAVGFGSALSVLTVVTLSACAPKSADLGSKPEIINPVEKQEPVEAQFNYVPKVDILFVIDTSASMKPHIDNLTANVGEFVDSFDVGGNLDFRIGVVSVFDSRRFGPVVKDFYPLGKLRPLKDPELAGQAIDGPQFVTRSERFREVLKETLNLNIEPREKCKYTESGIRECVDLGGPEYEELFTPVMAATSDKVNPGFIRPDAHLAVILITDANDDSTVTESRLNNYLMKIKGNDHRMYSTYAVLALDVKKRKRQNGDVVKVECQKDPSGAPVKIQKFLSLSQGQAYSLCSDWGPTLAEVGQRIQNKANSHVRVSLDLEPDINSLQVSLGKQQLAPDQNLGWTYDPVTWSIMINGNVMALAEPGAKLNINYVPIDQKKREKGRVTTIGD